LDQADYELLARIERGNVIFKPEDRSEEGKAAFQHVVAELICLRSLGLVRFLDGRIMQAEDGTYLMVGPCDLTPVGIAALANDRSLGPRPPTP
jgi:hypothetical protein